MAKIHQKRLKMHYEFTKGGYRELIQRILQFRVENIQDLTLRMYDDFMSKQNAKISGDAKRMRLPDIRTLKPSHQFNKIRSKETGDYISTELKRILNERLRRILASPGLGVLTGVRTGTIRQKAVSEFQKEVKRIFAGYTKIDKVFGVPKNVKGIATTALRTASNSAKHEYFKEFLKENKDVEILKRWIHNPRLSKNPRKNHSDISKLKPIPFRDMFLLKTKDGRVVKTPHPHWSGMPIGEVINCNCEVQYLMKRK